jgi:hypothetical protein
MTQPKSLKQQPVKATEDPEHRRSFDQFDVIASYCFGNSFMGRVIV